MGQMLRGGRSWPPQKNSAGGDRYSAKAAGTDGAGGKVKASPTGNETEQQVAHELHLPVPSWPTCEPWSCCADPCTAASA